MYIDVHGHAIENMWESAGKYGPRVVDLEDGFSALEIGDYRGAPSKSNDYKKVHAFNDVAMRIAEMNRRGIDHLIQSTSPLFYMYWVEPEVAARSARVQNDAMAASTALHPTRLSWSATLPMQDIPASIAELKRALDKGACSVSIGTDGLGGRELDDEALWPLYETIQALGIPIILHPHPLNMSSGEKDRYNLNWVVGYNYSETMAFARLALGGVFDDFPKLRIVLPHGGGAVPYQIGRIDEARKSQADSRAKRPVSDYFENIYFEILIHDIRARRLLLDMVGPSHIVIGSNLGGWDSADGVKMLQELDLPKHEHDMIAYQNAMKLFKLENILAVQTA